MTLHNQLVQIVALLGVEAAQAKIIQDDKIGSQVAAEDFVVGAVCTCLTQIGEQRIRPHKQDGVTGAHGGGPQALGQHGLSDADGSDENAMLLARQELEREHVLQLTPIELDWRGPVEADKGSY